MRASVIVLLALAAFALAMLAARPARAAPEVAASEAETSARDKATVLYKQGIDLADQGKWDEALSRFYEARQLYASWKITSWIATCLENAGRYDEALEAFEALLREHGREIPPEVKVGAQNKLDELRRRVGIVEIDGAEPGATVTLDGRPRGAYPLPGPLRVVAGAHVVLVFLEGFEPFVKSIDVVAERLVRVPARMRPLRASGRLRVAEESGEVLDLLLDGSMVGKTPWEGVVAPGDHVVALQGEGNRGTPPVRVVVEVDRTVPLVLKAEQLEAALRVEPLPASASVAIDGVPVGRGIWDGQLLAGVHRVEVTAPGFVPARRRLGIDRGRREVLRVTLEPEEAAPQALDLPRRSRFTAEIATSLVLASSFEGEVGGGCGTGCSASPAVGGEGIVHAGYELGSGLGFGVTGGVLSAVQSVNGWATQLLLLGAGVNRNVTAADLLRVRGALVGAWIGWSFFERVPVHLRLGAGALLGSVYDARTYAGSARDAAPFQAGPVVEIHGGRFVYVRPELRLGLPLSRHVELSLGLAMDLVAGVPPPRWGPPSSKDPQHLVYAGSDRAGTFPSNTLVGDVFILFAPGVGARYDF